MRKPFLFIVSFETFQQVRVTVSWWGQRMRVWRWLLLSHALGQHPHEHVLYVNEECGRADATSRNGAWRCADGSALPPPVVVVGSDGSGTRVVAKALSLMGVTMLVERSLYTQMVGTARPRAQESLR